MNEELPEKLLKLKLGESIRVHIKSLLRFVDTSKQTSDI